MVELGREGKEGGDAHVIDFSPQRRGRWGDLISLLRGSRRRSTSRGVGKRKGEGRADLSSLGSSWTWIRRIGKREKRGKKRRRPLSHLFLGDSLARIGRRKKSDPSIYTRKRIPKKRGKEGKEGTGGRLFHLLKKISLSLAVRQERGGRERNPYRFFPIRTSFRGLEKKRGGEGNATRTLTGHVSARAKEKKKGKGKKLDSPGLVFVVSPGEGKRKKGDSSPCAQRKRKNSV